MASPFGYVTAKAIAYLIIGIILFIFSSLRKLFIKKRMPNEEELKSYIKEIQELKKNGATYQERMEFLKKRGLPKEICEAIIMYSEEQES